MNVDDYRVQRLQGRKLNEAEKRLVGALREEPVTRQILAELVAHNDVYVSYFQPINLFDAHEDFVVRFPEVAVVKERREGGRDNTGRGNTYALKRKQWPEIDGPSIWQRYSEMLVFARADNERAEILDGHLGYWVEIDGQQGRLVAEDGRLLLVKKGSLGSFKFEGDFQSEEDKEFEGKPLNVLCYKSFEVPVEHLFEEGERKLLVLPGKLEPWRIYSERSAIGKDTGDSWGAKIMSDAAERYHALNAKSA